MIEILGTTETEEYQAAKQLRSLIAAAWPAVDASETDRICIIPAAKCYGQAVQDIDLVVICKLAKPISLPHRDWMKEPKSVLSFVLTIEVKGHHGSQISFEGPKVFVRYSGGLRKDASEQSHKQKYALLEYIKRSGTEIPYVINLIWLTAFSKSNLPKITTNVLGEGSDWSDFLVTIAESEQAHLCKPGINLLQAFPQAKASQYLVNLVDVFAKKIVDTPLDRRRIEKITQRLIEDQKYATKLGEQLLIFRGRGGTGKTITLIRLAHDLYSEKSARTLILTYNLTLVSDIRRTLSIIGIPTDRDGAVVAVKSVHKFMLDLMNDAGIINGITDETLSHYDELLIELAELSTAFTADEVPPYDFVFIDEAQDWPEKEKEIVFNLFGPKRCVIADGVDQLVRSNTPNDWTTRLRNSPHQVVGLRRSLRLKSSIAGFVNEFAQELDVPGWNLMVNTELHGGRVTVLIGEIEKAEDTLIDVFQSLAGDGNKPIDSLVCVPNTTRSSVQVRQFVSLMRDHGIGCWDGTDKNNRSSFPRNVEETRLVTYDSCRGLEGWTVICLAMDRLFDQKLEHQVFAVGQEDLYTSDEERARRAACAWTMIPLTRAIDHLVLHIGNSEHFLAGVMRRLGKKMGGPGGWLSIHEL